MCDSVEFTLLLLEMITVMESDRPQKWAHAMVMCLMHMWVVEVLLVTNGARHGVKLCRMEKMNNTNICNEKYIIYFYSSSSFRFLLIRYLNQYVATFIVFLFPQMSSKPMIVCDIYLWR